MKHQVFIYAVLFTFGIVFVGSVSGSLTSDLINQIHNLIRNKRDQISEDVQFFLYTRNNRDSGQQIWIDNDESLKNSKFDPNLMTKFVVHGWTNNHTTVMSQTVKNAFLDQDNYNVVLVDWGKIAAKSYPSSVAQLKEVGYYVGQMIVYLENGYLDLKKLSIVGHSLGAHVGGLAAKYVKKTRDQKILHVVGLDPANPGFEIIVKSWRINSDDGDLVEIVHTNIGIKGLFAPLGHLDFYPNGMSPGQPGCGLDLSGSCSHARSFLYYAEALTRPSEWIGIRCGSFIEFLAGRCKGNGLAEFPLWTANFTKPHGTYALVTNSSQPYGLGIRGVHPSNYYKVIGR